jgi:hypothetical protein
MSSGTRSGIAAKLGIGGIAVAVIAAALAIYAVFQAAFQVDGLIVIGDNTLLHKEAGWPIVICALGIVGAACLYRLDRSRATIWALLIVALGALIFGATVYQEAGGRASVEAEQFPDLFELIVVNHASPAIGLQLAKLAGILAVVSGLVLAGISLGPPSQSPPRQSAA